MSSPSSVGTISNLSDVTIWDVRKLSDVLLAMAQDAAQCPDEGEACQEPRRYGDGGCNR